MKKFLTIIGIFGGFTLSHAQSYVANLDGAQEVPPNASTTTGFADFTLGGSIFSVTIGYVNNFYSAPGAVTVNDAAPGNTGPALFDLTWGNAAGYLAAFFNGSGTLTAGEITDLNAGNLYVNIESTDYPDGEIRGQLEEVPEPSTLALIGAGALALLARRRGKV